MREPVRIWAPLARQVEVVIGSRRVTAAAELAGWWRGPVLAAGDDYAIALDGGPPRPDPRSRWQPHGVHGPSRWVDPPPRSATHGFRPVPLHEAVIYELHIGTFSEPGTFVGAISHLDHLVALGITHVELMPIAQFSGVHGWGYDGVDLFAPHAPYGGPAGLHQLIDACHQRELAVLIDVVHNHLGPEGSYLSEFGPYRTAHHRTPWGEGINFDDRDSSNVRRFFIDSAVAWLRDYAADGLRLDALHALHDDSEPHFVAELADEVRALERALARPFVLIGEYDDHDPRVVTEREAGGWGLDAHWNDDFHHAVHALLTGETSGYYGDFADRRTLAKVLHGGYALDGVYSPFRGGRHGKPFGDRPRDRLIGYVQSHDQLGNRAAGERLPHLVGIERTKIAAAILMVSPFVPMLFQGEEWAASSPFCYFADLESPELRRAVVEGRRAEHSAAGWTTTPIDPIDPATRALSVLRWDERERAPHADMLTWYRELIALRRRSPGLRDPSPRATRVDVIADGQGLRIDRPGYALIVNLSDQPLDGRAAAVVLASAPVVGGVLSPVSCAIVRR